MELILFLSEYPSKVYRGVMMSVQTFSATQNLIWIYLFTQHCQHHGCWWPVNARIQAISSPGVETVCFCIPLLFLQNYHIVMPISLKFVLRGAIDNTSTLVQLMAWGWIADKSLPVSNDEPIHGCIYASLGPLWIKGLVKISTIFKSIIKKSNRWVSARKA